MGIEIFGRSADYDTALDPIVPVTAAEIRKRIAQYYQEPGREVEIRVSIPAGSYVPQFHWPQTAITIARPDSAVALPDVLASIAAPDPVHDRPYSAKYLRISAALVLVLGVALGGAWRWRSVQRSAFDVFSEPVLNSGDPVLFCIADQNQYKAIALRDAADPNHQTILKDNLSAVVIDDLSSVVKIAGVLQAHGTKYSLKGEASTTLSDLRNGPTVFVGAFDNAWTLRLTKPLRFHFANNADMTRFWIADSDHPDRIDWVIDRAKQQATNNYRDYAIVTQFTDGNTGKIAVVAAGVGRRWRVSNRHRSPDPDRQCGSRLRREKEYGVRVEHRNHRRTTRHTKNGGSLLLVVDRRPVYLATPFHLLKFARYSSENQLKLPIVL